MAMSRNASIYPNSSTSKVTTLPSIFAKAKERNFRKPPKIEVLMNKRTLFKPYSMMHGDNIADLRHMEHTELSDKTRSRNKVEVARCWKRVNLSYKDHLYAMGGIRQEQSLVYQVMCQVQRNKRKIQKQAYKRREEDLLKNMKWNRVKDMCRHVVLKFRENVERKKRGRLQQEGIYLKSQSKKIVAKKAHISKGAIQNKTSESMPGEVISQESIAGEITDQEYTDVDVPSKYSNSGEITRFELKDGIRYQLLETLEETDDNEDTEMEINFATLTQNKTQILISDISLKTKSKSETELLPLVQKQTVVHSEAYEKFQEEVGGQIVNKMRDNKEGHNTESNNYSSKQQRSNVKARVIQVRKDKSSKPLTRVIEKNNFEQLPSIKQKIIEAVKPDIIVCSNNNTVMTDAINIPGNQAQNIALSPTRNRRQGIIRLPDSYVLDNNDRTIKSTNQSTEINPEEDVTTQNDMCQVANQKHKEERESLVFILKKRERARAKKDLDNLNAESFVRYERTKSGFLKAYPGKRETFATPSSKNAYLRNKMLRQERETILLQRAKLKKFYDSVMELTDRQIIHETPPEVIETNNKELPNLEDNLSQMTNSIFNVAQFGRQLCYEEDTNRYARVYHTHLKGQDNIYSGTSGRRMSSWKM